MQTKPKSNSIITSAFNAEANVITFTILNHGDVTLDLNKVSAANLAKAAIHGFNQRIPDAAAIGVADSEGNVIPRDERTRIKYERMNDLCRFYESGTEEWARRAPAGEGGGKSITVEAIARVKSIDYETAKALVERHAEMHKMTYPKALAFLRQGKRVQDAILAIRAERAAGSSSEAADELLDSMGEASAEDAFQSEFDNVEGSEQV